jgi:hypothetical protein
MQGRTVVGLLRGVRGVHHLHLPPAGPEREGGAHRLYIAIPYEYNL